MKRYLFAVLTLFITTNLAEASVPQVGIASWYGTENKKSSTGKLLRHDRPETAHKTAKINSKLRVTDVRTGKSVEVTVVDRGPYVRGRIVDLNIKAAQMLGIIQRGTALVKVEVISEPYERKHK